MPFTSIIEILTTDKLARTIRVQAKIATAAVLFKIKAGVTSSKTNGTLCEILDLKEYLEKLEFDLRDTMDIGDIQLTASIFKEITDVEDRISDLRTELADADFTV